MYATSVHRACAQIAIEGLLGAPTDAHGPFTPTLAHDPQDALVEIDVLGAVVGRREAQSCHFRPTDAGVDEHPQERVVAATGEAGVAFAGRRSFLRSASLKTSGSCSGMRGGFMRASGLSLSSPSATSQSKKR